MAIQKYQIHYRGPNLTAPSAGIVDLPAPETGNLTKIRLKVKTANALGDTVFNLAKNGVDLFDDELTIPATEDEIILTGLSVPVTEFDELVWKLDTIATGGVTAPIYFQFWIDDGVPTYTLEQFQDTVAAMMQAGGHTSWVYDDTLGKLSVDAVQLTDEEVQDKIGALLSGGANTTVTYNDGANTLVIAETTAGKTTEEIQDIIAGLLAQGANITLTYDDAGNALTIAASGGGTSLPSMTGQSGKFLTNDGTTASWGTASGSVPAWLTNHPDTPPASPPAQNDEFETTSLDAKWTQATTGTAPSISNHGLVKSHYWATFGAADGLVNITEAWTPGAVDTSITAKFSISPQAVYQGGAIYLMDTAASLAYKALFYYNAGNIDILLNELAPGSTTRGSASIARTTLLYIHLQRVGSAWSAYFSYDGRGWIKYSTAASMAVTIAKIRVELYQSGAATKQVTGCDWIRRDWLFL